MAKPDNSQNRRWGKSPWTVALRPRRQPFPSRADFVVVGGGFAGLSASVHLRRFAPAKSVLLLEAGRLGDGASGRTGGMALDETAAGKLPGTARVLADYGKILRSLHVEADLSLTGAWEIGRGRASPSLEGKAHRLTFKKNSPICWTDSGHLRVVRKVPGGTVDPGKVIAGLARSAEKSGVHILEHAEVRAIDFAIDFGSPVRLRVQVKAGRKTRRHVLLAKRVLLATNAGALDIAAAPSSAEPKLTFAIATAALTPAQVAALGMSSGRPFYTVDLPYLWGRRFAGNRLIFGSGLFPSFEKSIRRHPAAASRQKNLWSGLEDFDVRTGDPAVRLRALEQRVRGLHPVLKRVRVTHKWCGPILITPDWHPIFRRHPKSPDLIVLGGFSGHGVALSVFLGRWAAQAMVKKRPLPSWG